MAGKVILACEMIEDEVRLALESLSLEDRPPVVWVQSGLHERPELLKRNLQEKIAQLDEGAAAGKTVTLASVRPGRGPAVDRMDGVQVEPADEVLLALGFCGSALQGLSAEHLRIVFPRVDDCVALFLGGACAREEIPRDPKHYYLTRGWFEHESTLKELFEDWEERLGSEKAAEVRKKLFAGYERVSLIDTKAYDTDDCLEQSQAVAAELELEHGVVQGSVELLERLFKGEQGGEIVAVEPKETIELSHLFAV